MSMTTIQFYHMLDRFYTTEPVSNKVKQSNNMVKQSNNMVKQSNNTVKQSNNMHGEAIE